MKKPIPIFALILLFTSPYLFAAIDVPNKPISTDGDPIQLHELKGQVIYVDFWASWCSPCRKSFPWLNEMQQKYAPQGFKVIAINVDSERQLADEFLNEYRANFTIGYDAKGELASAFKVQGMPSSFLIDRNGVVRHTHVGFREKEVKTMEGNIQALLNE